MKQSTDVTLEVRSTDGTAAEFYQSDAERVTKASRFLATPRLFAEARPSCIVCQAEIVDDHWFCRLPKSGNGESNPQNRKILLCSPRCALRHFASLYPPDNGFDSDYEQHQHTFHFW
jgi:hypothetical protein